MPGGKEYPIKIALRIRPRNKAETETKQETIVKKTADKKARLQVKTAGRVHDKTYSYDHVFGPDAQQLDVYEAVVGPCIQEVLQGYNCTVFAYGQTGTGKTHTMEGIRSNKVTASYKDDRDSGLIPRALNHLFEVLESNPDTEYSVRVSYLEIYNEDIFDLLGSDSDFEAQRKLAMYEDTNRKGSVIIKGLEEVIVRSKADVYDILAKGAARRSTAETMMNKQSSRSHSVFSCTVHQKESTVDGEELVKTGKVYLVDLAGAENIGRSGARNDRAREAGNINQSLLTLGRVISKLVERAGHIPYRESKLTRLLQDSLGGRTKTSIIATVSPAVNSMEETMSTMDYALRAKSILNRPEANAKLTKKTVMLEFTKEIEQLKADLLAAREKNGVFLTTERHLEMNQALEAQKNEIEELSALITARNAEFEQIQALFATTEAELKTTSAALTETKVALVDTETARAKAEQERIAAEAERDETKYVLGETQTTEQSLHRQATGLVEVAQTTTAHVDALHAKVSRTSKVTETNYKVATTAKELILNGITAASESSQKFAEVHSENLGSIRCDVTSFVHRTTKMMGDLQSRIDDMQQASEMSVCEAYGGATATAAVVDGATEVCITTNDADATRLVDSAKEFAESQFPRSQRVLRAQIDDHAKMIKMFAEQVENHFARMQQSLDEFASETSKTLSALKNTTASQLEEQAVAFEAREREIATFTEERNRQSEEAIERVKKDVAGLLSAFIAEQSSALTTGADEIRANCSTSASNARDHSEVFQSDVETVASNLDTFMSDSKASVDEGISSTQTSSSVSTDITNTVLKTIAGTHEEIVEHHNELTDGISNLMRRNNASVESVRQLHSTYASDVTAQASANATVFNTICTDLKASVDNAADGIAYFGTSTSEQVESVRANACQQNEQSVSQLKEIATEISGHIESGLQVVVPTGETPMRQVYTFETELAQTAPTPDLIERYHTEIRMETLVEDDPSEDTDITDSSAATVEVETITPLDKENAGVPEVPTNSKLPTKSWSPFKRGSKRQSKKKPLSTAN